jgi:hypothetical protein
MVPLLLLSSNKHFGVSSSFRHVCAAAFPKLRISYLRYNWKDESWSLVMMAGVIAGAAVAVLLLDGNRMPGISDGAREMFRAWGLSDFSALQPGEIFAVSRFGTRYGGGCTSGHAVMGMSLLSLGSLVATVSFFLGGLIVSNLVVPALFGL